jgi:hypothetical protein
MDVDLDPYNIAFSPQESVDFEVGDVIFIFDAICDTDNGMALVEAVSDGKVVLDREVLGSKTHPFKSCSLMERRLEVGKTYWAIFGNNIVKWEITHEEVEEFHGYPSYSYAGNKTKVDGSVSYTTFWSHEDCVKQGLLLESSSKAHARMAELFKLKINELDRCRDLLVESMNYHLKRS